MQGPGGGQRTSRLTSVRLGRRRSEAPPVIPTACLSPETSLYFMTDGDVRTCCMNDTFPLGNITRERLPEIWAGARRQALVDRLRANDFSLGCHVCDWQATNEGEDESYARRFDEFGPRLDATPLDERWPQHLEFNLSNKCNLQCVQCHGALSSSIRIHREKLPAIPRVYDEQFFEDVVPFLARAVDIQVAGGEPFLGPESLRLFDLMATHATGATCSAVTNATQWNKRVEHILESLPLSITISIDGITKDVYESIRIGADLDEVLRNIDRFVDYARRRGTHVWFNHCLMVQNYADFGNLLLFAEARGIRVNVSVVYRPIECSLGDLDRDALGAVCDELEAQSAAVLPQLRLNAEIWTDELTRLRSWHRFRTRDDDVTLASTEAAPTYIFGLNQWGVGRTDEQDVHERLRQELPGQQIHWLTIGVGDRIVDSSAGAATALGFTDDVVGETGDAIQTRMAERYGAVSTSEVLEQTDDHIDQVVTYGDTPFRATVLALRDDTGRAEQVRLFFSVDEVLQS